MLQPQVFYLFVTLVTLVITERGRASVPFYMLWARGARKLKDLTINKLASVERYIEQRKLTKIKLAIRLRAGNVSNDFLRSYLVSNKFKVLESIVSKGIREARMDKTPLTVFKIGYNLSSIESTSWGLKLTKLSSTRHKNVLLRVAHGEIYTKERLNRFGLTNDPLCPRCQAIETLQHKFIECSYVRKIWDIVINYTEHLTIDNLRLEPLSKIILGSHLNSNSSLLTINAEIIQRILSLRDDANYLLHPKIIVKQTLLHLLRREKRTQIKTDLESIINERNL